MSIQPTPLRVGANNDTPTLEMRYVTAKEAAAFLSINENSLSKMRLYGGGPPFTRIGRRIRYNFGSLQDWLRARTSSTEPLQAALDGAERG